VHVPWGTGRRFEEKLQSIRVVLRRFEWVYSLNYDLILYWAAMSEEGGTGIVDFFWHPDLSFDPADTELPNWVPDDSTRLVWLHGGIHLRRRLDGTTFKARSSAGSVGSLLDQFGSSYAGEATPLLVSEGTAEDKYRAITRSSYLEFGLRSLTQHADGLIIFGSSLRLEDAHFIRAINDQPGRAVAVSIRPMDEADIVQRKAELRTAFPTSDLYFFESETCPLGDSAIRVSTRFSIFHR
jgi:hypothetical protein